MFSKKRNILAIIPARSGSKRIKKKNVKILSGKPLISYTIEAAIKSKYLDKIIVSSDSEEVLNIAKQFNTETIKRLKILSRDKSKTIDVVFNVIDVLKKKGYCPDIVVLLQPTSPLRTTYDIDKSIEIFINQKCKSVISVSELKDSLHWSFIEKNKFINPVFGWKYLKHRSQDLPKVYIPNGAIYIFTEKQIKESNSFYSRKILPYIMPEERSIDIDSKIDFMVVELLIKKTGRG